MSSEETATSVLDDPGHRANESQERVDQINTQLEGDKQLSDEVRARLESERDRLKKSIQAFDAGGDFI